VRCFAALELPASVRRACAQAAAPLRTLGTVSWVAELQIHVTLRFFGEIDPRTVDKLAAVVQGPWPAMQLSVHGLGQFPKRGSPRVLWTGLRGDVDALAAVAQRIDDAAVQLGLPPEERAFHPHITLGRCKSPFGGARLERAVREHADAAVAAPFAAERVVLYHSELRPDGPVYRELAAGRCGR
jgi:RNA 2',3'-cyclic 3'-phosphodiesterase